MGLPGGRCQPASPRPSHRWDEGGGANASQTLPAVSLKSLLLQQDLFVVILSFYLKKKKRQTWQPQLSPNAVRFFFFLSFFFPSPTCAINAPRPPAAPSHQQQQVGTCFWRLACRLAPLWPSDPSLKQDWVWSRQTGWTGSFLFFPSHELAGRLLLSRWLVRRSWEQCRKKKNRIKRWKDSRLL